MCKETSKASRRRMLNPLFTERYFSGDGIDIGCGPDILSKEMGFPKINSVDPFDLEHGDAQYVDKYISKKYDFVHSSQCLEHLHDPFVAINSWLNILKPGGYLVCTFPDEDLYEQGFWPPKWNTDHKKTFSIYKQTSWSPVHINVIDLIKGIKCNINVISLSIVDTGYIYDGKIYDQTFGDFGAEAFIELIIQKCHD